jgi:hypothetical protein
MYISSVLIMMSNSIDDRLNSCSLFARRICPEQQLMEKICLVPQFVTPQEWRKISPSQCCTEDLVLLDAPQNKGRVTGKI